MTLQEFKAWFEGFSEVMDGPPDAKQWKRIKARVSEIDSKPISYPVYIDRYVTPYRRWWGDMVYGAGANGGGYPILDCVSTKEIGSSTTFNPLDALTDAGRAEYRASLAS
ncbi:hypothetical protein [Shinella sp. JR1-6]|uniref:hypothetical protein n=1 Tax=Shinella sp. JR1-6 TaxID=2527671 RepID=UPI00102D51FC|nr:hypothetical protein [Shinella sp. JR1-6]TAA48900.1 hypothetical protein EXZ48_34700 [Shinella sp. JR1-6]